MKPHATITGTCKLCGLRDQFFGPATIVFCANEDWGEHTVHYVNCKRCGAMLVVGRDVEEVRREAV